LRDQGVPGIKAVIVYPMNALAVHVFASSTWLDLQPERKVNT
jgi:hypothetical protein